MTSKTKRVKMPAIRRIFRNFKEADPSEIMNPQRINPSAPLLVKQAWDEGMKHIGSSSQQVMQVACHVEKMFAQQHLNNTSTRVCAIS
jgi:hypothetical protein